MGKDVAVDPEHGERVLSFFKALADVNRLRIVGIPAEQERSVEELATLLTLKPPAISHHLARLEEAGLVRVHVRRTSPLYALDTERLQALRQEVLQDARAVEPAGDEAGAFRERKVLRDFLDGDRLKAIPSTASKRDVVLRWLAARFTPGTRYREREVNDLLLRHYADSNTLRRLLIDEHLLQRTADGSAYWRVTGT